MDVQLAAARQQAAGAVVQLPHRHALRALAEQVAFIAVVQQAAEADLQAAPAAQRALAAVVQAARPQVEAVGCGEQAEAVVDGTAGDHQQVVADQLAAAIVEATDASLDALAGDFAVPG